MYAQVIVDIVHERVARTFSYAVPEELSLAPGQRVSVPFGRRAIEGVVLSLTETCDLPPEKVKPVTAALEDYPAILPPLIALAQEMAEQTHAPLAETLRLMLPAQMRGGRVHVKTETAAALAVPAKQAREAAANQGRSRKRSLLLTLLLDEEAHAVSELSELVNDPLPALRQLAEAGLVTLAEREVLRTPGTPLRETTPDPILTGDQEEALSLMLPGTRDGSGRYLLHGVTGSGKTEVFIRLVRDCLERGRGAIILVPEIALTPQMVDWFRGRFGPVAAVLHSRLSAGERFDEWRRIRRGDARVVIGARSAVFAPLEKLGLIVVDEEHETTYLSDRHPRYDARDIARSRCGREGAALVLASATPSILSFARARRGDYRLIELPQRVLGRPMPSVEIVDMRRELDSGNRSIFSRLLAAELDRCVEKKEQAMLLMNHRGYSSFVSCRACGQAVKCPDCDLSMTYHLGGGDGLLHCHYCGRAEPVPALCPACGSRHIRFFGAGTQKVEEELRRRYPGVGIVRMDIDTTSGKDGHAKLLDEFRSGRAQLLVGTQMIAKGLDFPRVTLVGVVAADMTLNLPDYRARERTFQLLTQVAGRAGRGVLPGRVIIQTYKPEDPTIITAAAQDYRSFFTEEFQRRRQSFYPPFSVLTRLLVESPSEAEAQKTAEALSARVDALLNEHPLWRRKVLTQIVDQPGARFLRGKTRWHVLLKLAAGPDADALCAALTDLARETRDALEGRAEVFFEYNPVTML
ncbi:MAG: primosomal protein N' [Clostridia bacterium]|nr:primosomal protein N' [Clostridia bacterium]